jgi:hypothetical protein
MPSRLRIIALDRQRSTARRYRLQHPRHASGERLLAAAVIETRAGHLMLRETLRMDRTPA